MPKYDKTGPAGAGPRTGRGMGSCSDGNAQGGGFFGRCCGRGFGGFRRMSNEDRKEMLKEEAVYLKEDLEAVEKELAETEK